MSSEPPTRTRFPMFLVQGGELRAPDGTVVSIGPDPITVGRDASATVRVDDIEVSALHCEFRATVRGVQLRDLGSTNGTFVGNLAVSEARLAGACTVRVGQSQLEFAPAKREHVVTTDVGTSFGPLLGASAQMKRLYQVLSSVAPTDLSVLLAGETGTGKELAALAIHQASRRAAGPFVVLDCGSIPASLAESILFGHEKGSFTGATQRTSGVFQEASGGTVFLDELGELPEATQPKLLRVMSERTVRRVGAADYEPVDVRIIAATRRDIRREVNAGHFRSDLYFRIAQVLIDMPPLRERTGDIPHLVAHACSRVGNPQAAESVLRFIDARFRHYDWPGNVRELMNVATVLGSLGEVSAEALADFLLPFETRSVPPPSSKRRTQGFVEAKRSFELDYFQHLQEVTDGNISEIARRCGLARHQVRAHLRKLGLISGTSDETD